MNALKGGLYRLGIHFYTYSCRHNTLKLYFMSMHNSFSLSLSLQLSDDVQTLNSETEIATPCALCDSCFLLLIKAMNFKSSSSTRLPSRCCSSLRALLVHIDSISYVIFFHV